MNVLFDLDGTLTDPKEGIIACFRYAFDSLGVSPPPATELERLIGPPLMESFSNLLGPGGKDRVEQAVAALP